MSDLTYTIYERFFEPLEKGLQSVGIKSAFQAGVLATVLTAAAYWSIKPTSAFDKETGKPRPWTLLDHEESDNPTYVPWYIGSVMTGYTVNLII